MDLTIFIQIKSPIFMEQNLMNAYNISIVDDDEDDHIFIKAAIRNVLPAAIIKSFFDGSEFSANCLKNKSEAPSLIFLDLNMRLEDGKTTLQNIRRDSALNDVPVIILTTSTDPREKEKCLNLGANDYFVKPYTESDLSGIIESVHHKWLRAGI
jgi:CheY-like chemotaxis protein